MTIASCQYEDELLDALGRGYVSPELTAHVESCAACRELHTVAGALLHDRSQAIIEAPVPSAGMMWWRMQIRQRHDAQDTARRSLFVGQAITLTVAMLLMVSLGADFVVGALEVITSIRLGTPLLLALATWIILTPVAGYVALKK